ncbi:MAG TPA: CinA family protein [Jatrophihabitantaceae bacterium]|jgi:nicotinamide-nucleotide amidase
MTDGATDGATDYAGELASLHADLRELGATVAVAESLTGGLLAAALTATPGASATVRGGLVVYATDLKASLAGVSTHLLEERGAVDPDVALALARGARTRLGATYGLGVTGVAGPDPQDGKPVGTVFLALAGPDDETVAERTFTGDRAAIRAGAVAATLDVLKRECASAITALRSL